MYSLADLKQGLREPERIASELNRRYHRARNGGGYNHDGVDVFREDWDVLILLDACRYDEFEAHADLPGRLEHRMSRGSATPEFIRTNFAGKDLRDTVYVSANSWFPKLKDELNAELHRYVSVERDASIGFTSHPSTVTERATEAASQFPNKRLIIHYLQPHKPFLGEWGSERFENVGDLQTTVKHNDATREEVVRAYRENLNLVLSAVKTLLEELTGKLVVTADHGELLCEPESPIPSQRYGHPRGIYVDELVKVPWHVYQSGERRTITEGSAEAGKYDLDAVKEQLQELGYLE